VRFLREPVKSETFSLIENAAVIIYSMIFLKKDLKIPKRRINPLIFTEDLFAYCFHGKPSL
jgi:hypothetical protein